MNKILHSLNIILQLLILQLMRLDPALNLLDLFIFFNCFDNLNQPLDRYVDLSKDNQVEFPEFCQTDDGFGKLDQTFVRVLRGMTEI